jgi:hypothetical protein
MLSRVLWFRPPGRAVEVFEDDTFLVSFPKSGNVWLRFLLAATLGPNEPDHTYMNARYPDIYVASRRRLRRLRRPRLMKSHEYFDPKYPKVIYLARDPRDVALAYHAYHIRTGGVGRGMPLARFVDLFIEGGLDRFGTWTEHVGSWLGARGGCPKFLVVRYEDLRNDTIAELRRILDFLGLTASEARLSAAVQYCASETLQKLREERKAQTGGRAATQIGAGGAGQSTGLDPTLAAWISEACHPMMARLRYVEEAGG